MARLTITDLLTRRANNEPRDAALLTSVLARELDRQRASREAYVGDGDEDPAVVAAALWRAAAAVRRQESGRVRIEYGARERRRHHPPAAELRRSIRRLEQQLFAARQDLAKRTRRRRVFGAACLAIACVALLAFAVSGRSSLSSSAPAVADATIVAPAASVVASHTSDAIARTVTTTSPAPPPVPHRAARKHAAVRVTRRAPRRESPPQPASFAGGTRTFPWKVRFVDDFGR